MIATSGILAALECTKFVFGRGSAPYPAGVDTVCLFKTRLDKFWMHQDVMYDFAADLTGIGDRSVGEISRL